MWIVTDTEYIRYYRQQLYTHANLYKPRVGSRQQNAEIP